MLLNENLEDLGLSISLQLLVIIKSASISSVQIKHVKSLIGSSIRGEYKMLLNVAVRFNITLKKAQYIRFLKNGNLQFVSLSFQFNAFSIQHCSVHHELKYIPFSIYYHRSRDGSS
jgi:hypothetical protein